MKKTLCMLLALAVFSAALWAGAKKNEAPAPAAP
jgi:hypothetical protein